VSALLDVAEAVLERRRRREELEVYALHRVTTRVEAGGDGRLRQVGRSELRGLGVRLVTGDRTGFSSTTDLSDPGLTATVAAARAAAALSPPHPANRLPSPEPGQPPTQPGLPPEEGTQTGIAFAVDLARRTAALDRRVRTVDTASWREELTDVAVVSTTGVRVGHGRRSVTADVAVVAADDHGPASGYAEWWGRETGTCDAGALSEDALHDALAMLGPMVDGSIADLPLLLVPAVTAPLLTALGRGLTGPALQGRGPFARCADDRVASPGLDLRDDGRSAPAPATAPFDDEGVARQVTPLLVGGRIAGALHSSATVGPGERSTGNARRGTHRTNPVVAPTTLRLTPFGNARAEDAVVVRGLAGEGSGIRQATGRVDLGLVAHLLRNGAPAGRLPLRPWSTTLGEIWSSVVAVGDDERVVSGSPVLAPSVMLPPGSM
jgi:predicted Zn-dependent protease